MASRASEVTTGPVPEARLSWAGVAVQVPGRPSWVAEALQGAPGLRAGAGGTGVGRAVGDGAWEASLGRAPSRARLRSGGWGGCRFRSTSSFKKRVCHPFSGFVSPEMSLSRVPVAAQAEGSRCWGWQRQLGPGSGQSWAGRGSRPPGSALHRAVPDLPCFRSGGNHSPSRQWPLPQPQSTGPCGWPRGTWSGPRAQWGGGRRQKLSKQMAGM